MTKNSKIKNILISSFILMAIALTLSCKHNTTVNTPENTVQYVILKINPGFTGRQASPMLDQEILDNLEFEVTAKYHGTNRTAPTSSDADFFEPNANSNDPYEYKIKLDSGIDWDVTVTGLYNDEEILKGSTLVSVKSNGSYHVEIQLTFISSGTGNVDLEIDVTAVPDIAKLKISNSGNTTLNSTFDVAQEGSKRIIHITTPEGGITAGDFTPVLSFCTSDDITLFSIPETITVSKNMTTKYWIKSARNPFLSAPDSNGGSSFVITPALITQALNTIFYVNNTNGNNTRNSGNDCSSPFKNIEYAFQRINVSNNNDFIQGLQRDYIVFVENGAAATTLKADHPLNLYIYTIGETKLQLSGTLRTEKNVNLTLENFTVNSKFYCDDNSHVSASNVTFLSFVYVGHNPSAEDADPAVSNTASLTLTNNCSIENITYCYASTDGTQKCSINATDCTFYNSVFNYGNFTATRSEITKKTSTSTTAISKLECHGSSTTSFTALSTARKNIKGSVTLNNSSTASFTNMNLGADITTATSVTLNNTSSAVFENVEINKNLDAKAGSGITFAGATHFTGDVTSANSSTLNLASGVVLKIKDVEAGDSKLAAIKAASPSSNLTIIQSAVEGQTLTEAQVNRYELHNPGYYLAFDDTNAKGIAKLSSMQIKEPTFGGCTINIAGDKTTSSTGIISIGRDTSTGEKPLVITVTDPAGNALTVTNVKQYLGRTEIQSSSGSAATERTISFKCSELETYGLEIRFKFNEIEYSTMLTVKII